MKKNTIIGIIILLINLGWFIFFSHLWYRYKFDEAALFLFMFPDWIVILNIIIGFVGIVLGWKLIANKLKSKSTIYYYSLHF
ncbi:MAG: hypothetical protein LBR55_02575 [Bacteroidales bacterium]|nr:hypothetical protein [Bacteroidales bacterium]